MIGRAVAAIAQLVTMAAIFQVTIMLIDHIPH